VKIGQLIAKLEGIKRSAGDIEVVAGGHLEAVAGVSVSSGFDEPPVAILETLSSLRSSAGWTEPEESPE